jgi:hypothetical protein
MAGLAGRAAPAVARRPTMHLDLPRGQATIMQRFHADCGKKQDTSRRDARAGVGQGAQAVACTTHGVEGMQVLLRQREQTTCRILRSSGPKLSERVTASTPRPLIVTGASGARLLAPPRGRSLGRFLHARRAELSGRLPAPDRTGRTGHLHPLPHRCRPPLPRRGLLRAGVLSLILPRGLSAGEIAVGDWALSDGTRLLRLLDRRTCLARRAAGTGAAADRGQCRHALHRHLLQLRL